MLTTEEAQAIKRQAEDVLAILSPLSPEERRMVLALVGDEICEHCGNDQPDGSQGCPCWNDE